MPRTREALLVTVQLIGSGDGSVAGDAIAGVLAWTLSSGRAGSVAR